MSLKPKKNVKLPSLTGIDYLALIRALAAVIILIVANSFSLERLIYVLVSLAAILLAGFDLIFASVASIQKKDYFSSQILILIAAIAAFSAGCMKESVLLVVFNLITVTLLDFLTKRTKENAEDYISDENSDDLTILKAILSQEEAGETSAETRLKPILDAFTKAAVLVGVLYAVFMPMIADISYIASIRRALMLIIAASPVSLLSSLPVSSMIGISHAASCGVFIRDGETFEKTGKLNTLILDKSGVVTDGAPYLVSFTSPVFDSDTFLKLAAYIAYNSEQRIAAPILGAYKGDFHPEIIEKFREIPGSSMEMTVKGISVCLSSKEVLDTRRIEMPVTEGDREGLVLYLTVAGRYAGGMQFGEAVKPSAKDTVEAIKTLNDANVIIITEDSRRITKQFADELEVDEFISECDTAKKLESVDYAVSRLDESNILMYVTAENLDYHTAADIDARVGYASDNADMLLTGSGLDGLPYACAASKRTRKIQRENIIFAVIMKLALIIMSFAGITTLWFVVMADMVAAMLTVINTSRISDISFINKIAEKL